MRRTSSAPLADPAAPNRLTGSWVDQMAAQGSTSPPQSARYAVCQRGSASARKSSTCAMMNSDTPEVFSIRVGCTELTEGVKRRYDSSRRQEQAQENRRRIIVAAQTLFVDKGYGRTTIADIATAAGVAAETVYAAFRNKPTLLHRAWDVAVGGDEQDVHLLDRPEMRAVLAEPDLVTRLTR